MAGTMWPWPCLHRVMRDLPSEKVKGVTPLGAYLSLGTLVSPAHALTLDI